MKDFILHTGEHGAVLWHPRLLPQPLRAASPDAAQDMAALLLAARRVGVVMLADDAGQELRRELLPRLNFWDRRALLRRRMAQYFPPPALAACFGVQSVDKGAAAALVHLPERAPSQQWRRWLDALPNPQRGIILSSVCLAAIICRLAAKNPAVWTHGFILTPSGLRQISLHKNQPVLTRLIPVADPDDGASVAAVIVKARQESALYLARHGWQADAATQTFVILPPALCAALEADLPEGMTLLNDQAVAKRLAIGRHCGGAILLAAACYKFRLPKLYPAEAQRQRLAENITRIGQAAVAASVLVVGGLTASDLYGWRAAHHEAAAQFAAQSELRQAITQAARGLDGAARTRLHQRQAQLLRATMQQPSPDLPEILEALRKSLPPQVRLSQIFWQAEESGRAHAVLALRLAAAKTDKDAAQQESLALYHDLAASLRAALPELAVVEAQAPWALDSGHRYADPAMLDGAAPPFATAKLEIRQP